MSHTSRLMFGGGLVALAGMGLVTEAQAQAFADVKSAQVDYSKADFEPHVTCEDLARYKSTDIAEIQPTTIPADETPPLRCRVTGLLKPEIAFEVSLPPRWNGRFYMIGN